MKEVDAVIVGILLMMMMEGRNKIIGIVKGFITVLLLLAPHRPLKLMRVRVVVILIMMMESSIRRSRMPRGGICGDDGMVRVRMIEKKRDRRWIMSRIRKRKRN